MKKKHLKLIIIAAITLFLGLLGYLVYQSRQLVSELYPSEVVATNIGFMSELNKNNPGKNMLFFNGSSFEEISFKGGKPDTKQLTRPVPFQKVDKVFYSKKIRTGVVRTFYNPKSAFYSLDSTNKADWQWVVINETGYETLAKPNPLTTIVDVFQEDELVYIIGKEETKDGFTLMAYSLTENKSERIADELSAGRLVGVVGESIILQDYASNAYIVNRTMAMKKISGVFNLSTDSTCQCIVYTNQPPISLEETNNKQNSTSRYTALSSSGETIATFSVPESFVYYSNGYLVSLQKQVQPTYMAFYRLVDGEKHTVDTLGLENKVILPLDNVVVLEEDLSSVATTTTSDGLVLYSSGRNSIPESFVFPTVKFSTEFSFDYNIANNSVVIGSRERSEEAAQRSLQELAESCECNTGLLKKQWVVPETDEDSLYD